MTDSKLVALPTPPGKVDLLAGLLTFLVPGLGQLVRGRTTKGLIFLVGLYGLFFYGQWLGQWQNVYVGKGLDSTKAVASALAGGKSRILNRTHYVGQFFIGVAAWPAIYQAKHYDEDKEEGPIFGKYQREPSDMVLNEIQRNDDKIWDLAWVYTVIAGVLNILVIYDALAGPAFTLVEKVPENAVATALTNIPASPVIETPVTHIQIQPTQPQNRGSV
jgi:hypothetical protein